MPRPSCSQAWNGQVNWSAPSPISKLDPGPAVEGSHTVMITAHPAQMAGGISSQRRWRPSPTTKQAAATMRVVSRVSAASVNSTTAATIDRRHITTAHSTSAKASASPRLPCRLSISAGVIATSTPNNGDPPSRSASRPRAMAAAPMARRLRPNMAHTSDGPCPNGETSIGNRMRRKR